MGGQRISGKLLMAKVVGRQGIPAERGGRTAGPLPFIAPVTAKP